MRTFVIGPIFLTAILAVIGLVGYSRLVTAVVPPPYTAYQADVNHDGKVNPGDQAIVASKVGQSAPLPTATPTATDTPTATATATATPFFACNLSGFTQSGTQAYPVLLTRANFDGCRLVGANLNHVVLSYSSFRGADFTGAQLAKASLGAADLSNANLTGATIGGSLSGTNFQGAITTGITLMSDVSWYYTRCPDGTRSDQNNPNDETCVGHGFPPPLAP